MNRSRRGHLVAGASLATLLAGHAWGRQAPPPPPPPPSAAAAKGGAIRGTVFDREFKAPLARATVTVIETGRTVTAGDDGRYAIEDVPPGTYTLVFAKEGYVREVAPPVTVAERGVSDVDGTISGEFADMDEFVVQEVPIAGTESFQLKLRLESPALLDSVSSELISRAGASDAAGALMLVSGASVEDGKFAVVRGLPDRYVTALLNGVRIPTADEEKRAVQLDQFPAAVISSVNVTKTFTPDQQGDSSGGSVNVTLKGIPEKTQIQFKSQVGFNSQVVNSGNVVLDPNGMSTWGFHGGERDIPAPVETNWPGPDGVSFGELPAMDYKWSVSGGGKWDLDDDVKVGGFASIFYERESSYFDNGVDDSLWVLGPGAGNPMSPQQYQYEPGDPPSFLTELLDVQQSTQSVQWGGLGTFGIENANHSLQGTYLYTHNADDTATLAENTRGKDYYFPGYDPNDRTGPGNGQNELLTSPWLRLETLDYVERETNTVILNGNHTLDFLGDGEVFLAPKFDWTVSLSSASFDQPDKTQFGSIWVPPSQIPGLPEFGIPPIDTPAYWIGYRPAANFNLGWLQRIWKTIDEDSTQWAFNATLPFKQWSDSEGYVKTGYFNDQTSRNYTQETFANNGDQNGTWEAGWNEYWSQVFPSQNHPIDDGPPFVDVNYQGEQRIDAAYVMADLPVVETFKLVGGVRFENTYLSIVNDPEPDAPYFPPGATTPIAFNSSANVDYDQDDVLPAIAFEWEALEWLTLRGSYTQTVARQTFRELSPILQQEFLGGPIFIGNPDLTMSELENWDVRLDLTPFEGGLISFSWFYKEITSPIETVQEVAPEFTYTTVQNYPRGTINGVEIDLRQDFSTVADWMTGFKAGMNATLISASVDLPTGPGSLSQELSAIGFPTTSRDMTNTPEYLFNVYFTQDIDETGTQFGLFYTLTGDTLVEGAGYKDQPFIAYVPDVYALPIGTLNFTLQQELFIPGFKAFFQAKNILNPEIQTVYRSQYISGDVLNTSYTAGVDFAFGLSLQLDF